MKFQGIWLLTAGLTFGQECSSTLDRARQAYDSRQYPVAIAEFEAALNLCPQRGAVLLALGQAQLLAPRLDDSIETFSALIRIEPRNALAHKLIGDALYLSGKEAPAEESFQAALAIDPKHEAALYALGRVYLMQNRLQDAVARFDRVVQLDPKNYRAWDNLGVCYDALNRDADALRHFFKALDLVMKDHPDYDWAHANLADFFLRREQYEKAFQLAAEAARRNPASARNAFLTGKALSKLGKEDLSLRWLEQAVKLDPAYAEAWYLLATTCRKLGQKDRADEALARFRDISQSPRPRR